MIYVVLLSSVSWAAAAAAILSSFVCVSQRNDSYTTSLRWLVFLHSQCICTHTHTLSLTYTHMPVFVFVVRIVLSSAPAAAAAAATASPYTFV